MTNITLDDLAAMMQRGFQRIDEKFDGVDTRFADIEQRFNSIDHRFNTIEQRFDTVDQRFDAMDARLYQLIADVENIKERLASIEEFVQFSNAARERNEEDIRTIIHEMSALKAKVAKIEGQLTR